MQSLTLAKVQSRCDMDILHAFERRARLLERLERIKRWGIPLPEEHHRRRFHCPEAAFGFHSEPNWRGHCSYCNLPLKKVIHYNRSESYFNVLDERISRALSHDRDAKRLNIDYDPDDEYYDGY